MVISTASLWHARRPNGVRFQTPTAQSKDGVLELTLNRLAARNAIDYPMQDEIDSALDEAELDDDVRAVLIRGEGVVFMAGHDLKEASTLISRERPSRTRVFRSTFPRPAGFSNHPGTSQKPLMCGVHGCVGPGGTALACCADFIIAAEGTRLVSRSSVRG